MSKKKRKQAVSKPKLTKEEATRSSGFVKELDECSHSEIRIGGLRKRNGKKVHTHPAFK